MIREFSPKEWLQTVLDLELAAAKPLKARQYQHVLGLKRQRLSVLLDSSATSTVQGSYHSSRIAWRSFDSRYLAQHQPSESPALRE